MIEDIAEGKEKHRINKKHKVKDLLNFFLVDLKFPFKRDFFLWRWYKFVMFKCLLRFCYLNG